MHPFIAGYFGKERRVRDEFLGGRCAPLFGVKGGVLWDVGENWVIGPAIGVAANLRDGDNTSLFAEVEASYVTANKAYIGTGLGVWDFTDGDTVAPTALINFGVPIWKSSHGRAPVPHWRDAPVPRRSRRGRQQLHVLGWPAI